MMKNIPLYVPRITEKPGFLQVAILCFRKEDLLWIVLYMCIASAQVMASTIITSCAWVFV